MAYYKGKKNFVPNVEVDKCLGEIRRGLARHEIVNYETFYTKACDVLGSEHVGSRTHFRHYPEVNTVLRNLEWVNLQIEAFSLENNLYTFHDLEMHLCSRWNERLERESNNGNTIDKVSSYDELTLGPLQSVAKVREIFPFPKNQVEVLKIATVDILRSIFPYYKENKENKSSVDTTRFIQFLCNHFNVDNPLLLGLKLKSMKLLKKCHLEGQVVRDRVFQQKQNELEEDLTESIHRLFSSINLEPFERALRGAICTLPISDVLKKMLVEFRILMKSDFTKKDSIKNLVEVEELIKKLNKNKISRTVFHYAVSVGTLKQCAFSEDEIRKYLGLYAPPENNHVGAEANLNGMMKPKQDRGATQQVPLKDILEHARKALAGYQSNITLSKLKDIERKILISCGTGVENFQELGHHGSFLDFIDTNACLHPLLGELVTAGVHREGGGGESTGLSVDNVVHFLLQCDPNLKEDEMKNAICSHFSVVANGNSCLDDKFDKILQKVDLKRQDRHVSCIKYFGGVDSNESSDLSWRDSSVCDVDSILSELLGVPFMNDVACWMNWKTIYEPSKGDLKGFLIKHSSFLDSSGFLVYEDSPGVMVKIARHSETSLDSYKAAVGRKDACSTATQIVSIVCNIYGSVVRTPLQLMGSFLDKEDHSFVAECLSRIPLRMCARLVEDVFVLPLMEETRHRADVYRDLIDACRTVNERNHFRQLGWLIGITEWQIPVTPLLGDGSTDEEKEAAASGQKILDGLLGELPLDATLAYSDTETYDDAAKDHEKGEASMLSSIASAMSFTVPSSDADDAITETEQRNFVEHIRRDNFGCGLDMGEGTRVMENYHKMFGNSLEKLSFELYSKVSHFLLELIQNADDNNYEHETPAIAFVLDETSITIYNNETGFTAENVEALCNVGGSTKDRDRKGYIGHKGIGFKSVFTVTDTPEIHSGGFHIQLNSKSQPPFILPAWIDGNEKLNCYSPPGLQREIFWKTRIVLPLNSGRISVEKVADMLSHVNPALLMFLNRLEIMIVHNKISGQCNVMECTKLNSNILKLSNNNNSQKWFVHSKQLDMSVKKGDVSTTEVAIAFPLTSKSDQTVACQQVYAYLPVQSYGLKFVVQADFDVTSSRESITGNSLWNQEIITCLPNIFVDAFEAVKMLKHMNMKENAYRLFQCIPSSSATEPFRAVSKAVIAMLQQAKCIPVPAADISDSEAALHTSDDAAMLLWIKPCDALLASKSMQELIPGHILYENLGMHYVPTDISKRIGETMLSTLGVNKVSVKQLIEIGTIVVNHKWSQVTCAQERCSVIHWIAAWLSAVYHACDVFNEAAAKDLESLKSLPIFPLMTGKLVALNSRAVFLPSEDNLDIGHFRLLGEELNVLHMSLFDLPNAVARQEVKATLMQLGVARMSPQAIIHKHILPVYGDSRYKSIQDDLHIEYALYIHHQMAANPSICSISDLASLHVVTTVGLRNPQKESVYFGRAYKTPIDLAAEFPGVTWPFLSDKYVTQYGHQAPLVSYFEQLHVAMLFSVQTVKLTMTREELMDAGWKDATVFPLTADGLYVIEDKQCEELKQIIQNSTDDQLISLAEILDKVGFKLLCSSFGLTSEADITVKDTEGSSINYFTCSSLWKDLKQRYAWLPAQDGERYLPESIYVKNDHLFELLRDSVPYFKGRLANSDFIAFLGCKTKTNWRDVICMMIKWGREIDFQTDEQHMSAVYEYLDRHVTAEELVSYSRENPLIYVGDKMLESFIDSSKACWETQSSAVNQRLLEDFDCNVVVLCEIYAPQLKSFFVEKLNVSVLPPLHVYVDAMAGQAKCVNWEEPRTVRKLLEIQAAIGHRCVRSTNMDLSYDRLTEADITASKDEVMWKATAAKLEGLSVIPSSKKTMLTVDDVLLFPDNTEEMKRFCDQEGVNFVETLSIFNDEEQSNSKRHHMTKDRNECTMLHNGLLVFMMVCGVKQLTSCLEKETIAVMTSQGCQAWHEFLYLTLPFIQRYLYVKWRKMYNTFCDNNLPQLLANARFETIRELEVAHRLKYVDRHGEHRLHHVSVIEKKHFNDVHVADSHVVLQFSEDSLDRSATPHLAQLFSFDNDNLEDSLADMLTTWWSKFFDVEGLQKYTDKKCKGKELPDSEADWIVPTPPAPPAKTPKIAVEVDKSTTEEEDLPQTNADAKQSPSDELTCWPPTRKQLLKVAAEFNMSPEEFLVNFPTGSNYQPKGKPEVDMSSTEEFLSLYKPTRDERQGRTEERGEMKEGAPQRQISTSYASPSADKETASTGNRKEEASQSSKEGNEEVTQTQASHHKSNNDATNEHTMHHGKTDASGTKDSVTPFENLGQTLPETEVVHLSDAYVPVESSLGDISSYIGDILSQDFQDNIVKIGRAGERLVYEYLTRRFHEDSNVIVRWLNEDRESGKPCDIVIAGESSNIIYIEVKATVLAEKEKFEMSYNEIKFAHDKGESYELYRVSGLAKGRVTTIKKLVNLKKYLDNKAAKTFVML